MKQLFSILCILFIAAGCSKTTVTMENGAQESDHWILNWKYPKFTNNDENTNTMCATLSTAISTQVDSLMQVTKLQAGQLFANWPDTLERPAFKYELYVRDTIFLMDRHYISVRLEEYQYTGGAHGMTTFNCYNLDMHNGTLITMGTYLRNDKEHIEKLNKLLKQYLVNTDNCYNVDPTVTTPGFAGMNIGKDFLYFTFEAYALGPYACGPATIAVPIKEIEKAGLKRFQ
ncbi:MAG: DUF4163 domain-containing protein [Marinifilaceae bacterium]